jgi:hypothetical protein
LNFHRKKPKLKLERLEISRLYDGSDNVLLPRDLKPLQVIPREKHPYI